jgi:translation initiation factor 3 subunit I
MNEIFLGIAKATYATQTPVRTCGFSYSGNLVFYSTDRSMGKECSIFVRDIRQSSN